MAHHWLREPESAVGSKWHNSEKIFCGNHTVWKILTYSVKDQYNPMPISVLMEHYTDIYSIVDH